MLSEVDISLLIGAVIVGLVSWKTPRGILWIGVAALSYINATIAWRLDIPYAAAITAMGDTGVCLAVYLWGKARWELLIWRLFQISVAISIFYLAGELGVFTQIPHFVYSILMEAVNWLLLLLVFGNGIVQWIGTANVGSRWPWNHVRDFALALRAKRARVSFHRVP